MKVRKSLKKLLNLMPLEALFWIVALVLLIINDPGNTAAVSLCPFHNLGLDFCPGCGLGTSISYAFRGQLEASVSAHPLGIIAILILLSRVYKLFKGSYKEFLIQRKNNYG